jgi:hypothetical protein
MIETQIFEDELKQVKGLNDILMAHIPELEYRLAEASREKYGN